MGRPCLSFRPADMIPRRWPGSPCSPMWQRSRRLRRDDRSPDRPLAGLTAARETVHAAYLAAGRPDAYNEDRIYYVSDEQFAYVAYLSGYMVRERPAACFYAGTFFAETLILAENGNAIGAIQIAGTAESSQLPFFVAACDYTLIGEELFAASAYLSGEPHQLGTLKGQDAGKVLAGVLLISGCLGDMASLFPEWTPARR